MARSTRRAGLALLLLMTCCRLFAVDGIALTTHRSWPAGRCGWGTDTFGHIIKHTVRNDIVTARDTLYDSLARCVVFNGDGTRIAFVRQAGHIGVMNIDGSGYRVLEAVNSTGSWIDWPAGDWIYYFEKTICPPDNGADSIADRTLRRIHASTGTDQFVAMFNCRVWQFGMGRDTDSASASSGPTGASCGRPAVPAAAGTRLRSRKPAPVCTCCASTPRNSPSPGHSWHSNTPCPRHVILIRRCIMTPQTSRRTPCGFIVSRQ